MTFIDGDTHIDECDETWEYMPKELAPTTITLERDQVPPWLSHKETTVQANFSRFWFMDGQLRSHRFRDDEVSGTTVEARELYDPSVRVADMDRMNMDVQVLYPSLLLNELTRRVDLDVALCKSYNRWLAERCAQTNGRLRWVAMPPLSSIPDAVEELKFAKDHGAIGVFKRGIEWDRPIHDPYFFPVYQAANDLDLPICIHASLPWFALDSHFCRLDNPYPQNQNGITVLQAFRGLVANKVSEQFPKLRFGFVEAGSSWLPYFFEVAKLPKAKDTLNRLNFFVTCEPDEDLPYLVGLFGDDNFFIGTDYTHNDRSSVLSKHQDMCARSDIDKSSSMKIADDNARRFYGL